MTNQHPITPPDELVERWLATNPHNGTSVKVQLCTQAARWGADRQLEACDEWLVKYGVGLSGLTRFRAAMRPKPLSLKEQALARTDAILNDPNLALLAEVRETLELNRRALPAQPESEVADIHYAWELHDADGEWQAGGSANSLEDVQREGNRYLQTYSQDGPHKLIIQRHCVNTIEEATND